MAEFIDMQKWIEENTPHCTGKAVCMECRHEWQAVVPVGTVSFECPECHHWKGVFYSLVEDEGFHFACAKCGAMVFACSVKRLYCMCCGNTIAPPL